MTAHGAKTMLRVNQPGKKTMTLGAFMFGRPENWYEFDIKQVNIVLGTK